MRLVFILIAQRSYCETALSLLHISYEADAIAVGAVSDIFFTYTLITVVAVEIKGIAVTYLTFIRVGRPIITRPAYTVCLRFFVSVCVACCRKENCACLLHCLPLIFSEFVVFGCTISLERYRQIPIIR